MSADASTAVPVDDSRCFACGWENADGLRLRFRDADDGVVAETSLAGRFQGWQGVAHGGIVSTLLDEAMAHACAAGGESCVTASVRLRFRKPTPLGVPLVVRGRVTGRKRRFVNVAATLHDAEGRLLAEAEGEFLSLGPFDVKAFRERLPAEEEQR